MILSQQKSRTLELVISFCMICRCNCGNKHDFEINGALMPRNPAKTQKNETPYHWPQSWINFYKVQILRMLVRFMNTLEVSHNGSTPSICPLRSRNRVTICATICPAATKNRITCRERWLPSRRDWYFTARKAANVASRMLWPANAAGMMTAIKETSVLQNCFIPVFAWHNCYFHLKLLLRFLV